VSGRESAIAFVDTTCPRCGAARKPNQSYCLECGLALPPVTGRLPGLRRSWVRRFGWYPGDWIWAALLMFVVAAAGATAAIIVSHERSAGAKRLVIATASLPVGRATAVATTAGTGRRARTLPTPPEPTTGRGAAKGTANGRFTWPANRTGWTIVLVSFPATSGRPTALQTAAKAAKSRLPQVGVLDSSRYPSLQPGYFVVFSGIYPSQIEANAAIASVHQAGFGGAYSRQIGR
jgi:hypothetical protein